MASSHVKHENSDGCVLGLSENSNEGTGEGMSDFSTLGFGLMVTLVGCDDWNILGVELGALVRSGRPWNNSSGSIR